MKYIQRLSMNCCNCCNKDDEPTIIDGHEYIDLGLPSGKKWASRNIGADVETDVGLYFAWGETTGYDINGTEKLPNGGFTWENYTLGDGTNSPTASTFIKYNSTDNKTTLDLEDDAAYVNWGGDWRMPTAEDFEELRKNTNVQFVTNYNSSGVNGALFTNKKDNKKKMFLPFGSNSTATGDSKCCYWGASISDTDLTRAKHLHAEQNRTEWNWDAIRYIGMLIRPIQY